MHISFILGLDSAFGTRFNFDDCLDFNDNFGLVLMSRFFTLNSSFKNG